MAADPVWTANPIAFKPKVTIATTHYPHCNELCVGDTHYMDNRKPPTLAVLAAAARAYLDAEDEERHAFPMTATAADAAAATEVRKLWLLRLLIAAEYTEEPDEDE